jgi:hypothetical protein
MRHQSLSNRIRSAWRYFRSLSREPVSRATAEARKRQVNEELRRYVAEQRMRSALLQLGSPPAAPLVQASLFA